MKLVLDLLDSSYSAEEREDLLITVPSDLNTVYRIVVQNISEKQRPIVKVILQLLLVARSPFSLDQMHFAVSLLSGRHLDDIGDFLKAECGTFLILDHEYQGSIQFGHETFRTFVTDEKECPADFLINEAASHALTAMAFMRVFINPSHEVLAAARTFMYRITHLNDILSYHLKKCRLQVDAVLLSTLHKFVTGGGLDLWAKALATHWAMDKVINFIESFESTLEAILRVTDDKTPGHLLRWKDSFSGRTLAHNSLICRAAAAVWLNIHEATFPQEAFEPVEDLLRRRMPETFANADADGGQIDIVDRACIVAGGWDESNWVHLVQRGWAQLGLGLKHAALESALAACIADPTFEQPYLLAAEAHLALGNIEEARRAVETSEELPPRDGSAEAMFEEAMALDNTLNFLQKRA